MWCRVAFEGFSLGKQPNTLSFIAIYKGANVQRYITQILRRVCQLLMERFGADDEGKQRQCTRNEWDASFDGALTW